METDTAEHLPENPITKLLAQANLHVQNEQRSASNGAFEKMNTQEMMLMQMLKASSSGGDESKAETKLNNGEVGEYEEEEVDEIAESPSGSSEQSINRGTKVRYEVNFLLSLEFSPLVLPPSFWESELPPIEFFRLNKGSKGSFGAGAGSGSDGRRERRKSSNARRGSNLKKDKPLPFLEDMKKENSGNGPAREDRRTQRARQRENKRRGVSQKLDNSAIEEAEEFADAPEWMKEQDSVTGNSIMDFELWRLKMRIETAKRNGEEVRAEDMAEFTKLKSQAEANAQKNSGETEEKISQSEDGELCDSRTEATSNPADQKGEPSLSHVEEKVHRSVDDQFDIPLSTEPSSRASGSHFSSFFAPDKSSPPVLEKQSSSRLMSIISDGNQSPAISTHSPLPSQVSVASPPNLQPNQIGRAHV